MHYSRFFSLALFVINLYGLVVTMDDWKDICLIAIGLLLTLGLIWYGDEVGSYTGPSVRGPVNPTPGILLKAIGWGVLVLAILAHII